MVEASFESKSVSHAQWQFTIDVPGKKPPSRFTIRRLLLKFRETGCVANANIGNSGRPRSGRTVTNIETVRQRLKESPRKSIRYFSVDWLCHQLLNCMKSKRRSAKPWDQMLIWCFCGKLANKLFTYVFISKARVRLNVVTFYLSNELTSDTHRN